jgi:hypothetical protein
MDKKPNHNEIPLRCPACNADWQGDSFADIYRRYGKENNIEFSDKALQKLVERHLPETHQKLCINVQGTDIYICPACKKEIEL